MKGAESSKHQKAGTGPRDNGRRLTGEAIIQLATLLKQLAGKRETATPAVEADEDAAPTAAGPADRTVRT
jgi:hypothetical protein